MIKSLSSNLSNCQKLKGKQVNTLKTSVLIKFGKGSECKFNQKKVSQLELWEKMFFSPLSNSKSILGLFYLFFQQVNNDTIPFKQKSHFTRFISHLKLNTVWGRWKQQYCPQLIKSATGALPPRFLSFFLPHLNQNASAQILSPTHLKTLSSKSSFFSPNPPAKLQLPYPHIPSPLRQERREGSEDTAHQSLQRRCISSSDSYVSESDSESGSDNESR